MVDFAAIYFIQNDASTYRAFKTDGTEAYSGTNLVTDVLNSIESAHTSGGYTVQFGPGTFDMGTDNWTLNGDDDIVIEGAGIDVTIIQNTDPVPATSDSEPFSFTNCDRITIRDMTISAGGTARTSSDALDFDNSDECLVERVKISTSRGSGIVFDGKDTGAQAIRNVIRNCIVTGADVEGIQLLAADYNIVEGCHIHSNGEVGIKLNRKTSATVQSCQGNVIANNIIELNDESGIEVLEADETLIANNVIRNNGQGAGTTDDGIVIDDFATAGLTTNGNIVVGNQIYDDQGTATQDYGIKVMDAAITETLIVGNRFSGHVTDAILDSGTETRIDSNTGAPNNTDSRRNVKDFGATGDGTTNDSVAIQAAQDDLPSIGGTVYFPPGTYIVTDDPFTLRSNLRWLGAGAGTSVIKVQDSANGRTFDSTTTLNHVTFEDLVFDANGANQTDGAARDDRSNIDLDNIDDLSFIRCEFKNLRHGAHTRINACERTLITDCYYHDNGISGAAFIGDHSFASNADHYRVIGNTYISGSDTGVAQDGIQHSTVTGNTFEDNELAVSVSNSTTRVSKFNTVTGNSILGKGSSVASVTSTGIKVSNFGNPGSIEDATIVGNTIHLCDRAIWIDNVTRLSVIGNIISAPDGSNNQGILIGTTTPACDDVLIQGNKTDGNNATSSDAIRVTTETNALNFDVVDNSFNNWVILFSGTRPASMRFRGNRGFPDNTHINSTNTVTLTTEDAPIQHVDTTAGNITKTLPVTADAGGFGYFFRNDGANDLIVGRNGATIEGVAADKTLATDAKMGIYLPVAGSDWKIAGTEGTVT